MNLSSLGIRSDHDLVILPLQVHLNQKTNPVKTEVRLNMKK